MKTYKIVLAIAGIIYICVMIWVIGYTTTVIKHIIPIVLLYIMLIIYDRGHPKNQKCGTCDWHKLLAPDKNGGAIYGCMLRQNKVVKTKSCKWWHKYLGGSELSQEERLRQFKRNLIMTRIAFTTLIVAFLTLIISIYNVLKFSI